MSKQPTAAEGGLLEQFLEFAPDAIIGIGSGGEIVIANEQAEQIFGWTRDELLGKPVEMLLPDRFRQMHALHRGRYFEDPRTRPMGAGLELFGQRRDGSEFPAEISLSSAEAGDAKLALAAVRDVTDRVRTEQEKQELIARVERERQREQASRLESVGQLAGGVAHDFNNLLGVILNYADFVAEELEEGTSAHTDVVEIRRAAERATELTRQLLIFSRRDTIKTEPLDLNDSVREMERLLRRTLGEHIELRVELAPDLPQVMADAGQLEQVLVNLAVNARDAMPEGGRLLIETKQLNLDEEFVQAHPDASPGSHVCLTVADTGCGMDEETAVRAFEPFFSTKRKGEGTGLGLATVYGIVKGAGGQITIESEPGDGTSIKVHLPVSDGAAPEERADTVQGAPRGRGEQIIVVEDEDAVRTLATRILRRGGYEVTALSRGGEALELLADLDRNFKLLLSDVVMPEMRGVELVRRAREVRPGLLILMMSGYTTPISDDERSAIASAPMLEKPFTAPALLRQVRALIDGDGAA